MRAYVDEEGHSRSKCSSPARLQEALGKSLTILLDDCRRSPAGIVNVQCKTIQISSLIEGCTNIEDPAHTT